MTSKARSAATEADVPYEKSLLRDYVETILICVIFVIFSRAFVFQQSKIPSGSMMDTLLIGDYIMVNRFVYAPDSFGWEKKLLPMRDIRRGDVVVFKQPKEPEIDFIKRVIGLPGETIQLRDGRLFVDGEPIPEPYVEEQYRRQDPRRNFGPAVVPPGEYLVLGDHRDQSQDSRFWGTVPRGLMKGRALLVWWSYEEAGSRIYMSLSDRLKSWASKSVNFVTRTRWRRCFTLIH